MTIEDKLALMLIEDGISGEQLKQVIEKVKNHKDNTALIGCWQHSLKDYAPSVLLGPWMTARRVLTEEARHEQRS